MAAQQVPSWQVVRIIWIALFVSTFIYLGVMFMAAPPPQAPPDQSIALGLSVVGLMTAAVSVVLPKMMFKNMLRQMDLPTREVADPNASLVLRDEAPKVRVYEELGDARRAIAARFYPPFILGMAMSEAVAIYGLVLGFLGHPPVVTLPFFVIAWILMLPRFPREDAVMKQAEALTGVRLIDPTA